jgi:hypothetical protein
MPEVSSVSAPPSESKNEASVSLASDQSGSPPEDVAQSGNIVAAPQFGIDEADDQSGRLEEFDQSGKLHPDEADKGPMMLIGNSQIMGRPAGKIDRTG